MLPSPDEVLEVLGDLSQPMRSIPLQAWREVIEDERTSLFQYSRTRSNVMYDVMTRIARTEFVDIGDLTEYSEFGSVSWIVRDQLLVRYKKLDARRRPMNIMTQRTMDLLLQPQIPRQMALRMRPLPIAAMPRVVIGYVLNDLETEIDELLLVLTNGKHNVWVEPFTIEADGRIVDIPSLPATGLSGLPAVRPRIRGVDDDQQEQIPNHE